MDSRGRGADAPESLGSPSFLSSPSFLGSPSLPARLCGLAGLAWTLRLPLGDGGGGRLSRAPFRSRSRNADDKDRGSCSWSGYDRSGWDSDL